MNPRNAGNRSQELIEPDKAHDKDRYEFLPGLLEIQERPPHPASRVGIGLLGSMIILGLIWASVGKIDIVATATGVLIPKGHTKVVQSAETGTVTAILIEEGQKVVVGQILIKLDTAQWQAEKQRLLHQHDHLLLKSAALEGLISSMESQEELPPLPSIGSEQQRAFIHQQQVAKKRYLATQLEELKQQYQEQTFALAQTRSQVKKYRQIMPLLEERNKSLHSLMKQNLGARNQWLELEQDRIEMHQDWEIHKQREQELNAALQRIQQQQASLISRTRADIFTQRIELQQQISDVTQERIKVATSLQRMTIKSPVNGFVQQLVIHTTGAVVTPAQELLKIVPADQPLEARVSIENKDIGFIKEGQSAEIKVDAFPFTKYGVLPARIRRLSADAVADKNRGYIYTAHLSLEETSLEIAGKKVPMTPGMTVTAEIKTGHRRIIEFLIAPLTQHLSEGLKER